MEAIQKIADNYNLRVIYDAAHAFGVRGDRGSVLNHGDLSVLSFHATKVFTTCEGGAIVCPDAKTKQRIDHLKNFGFVDEVTVVAPGINGKMSEMSAALGLLQLKHVDKALARRREIDETYRKLLKGVKGIRCLHECGRKGRQSRVLPDPGGGRLPGEPRCALPDAQESQHPPAALFLPADFGFPDVPGNAFRAQGQLAGGDRPGRTSALSSRFIQRWTWLRWKKSRT